MSNLKFFLGFLVFVFLFGIVEWIGELAAPILGPAVILAMLGALIWALVALYKKAGE